MTNGHENRDTTDITRKLSESGLMDMHESRSRIFNCNELNLERQNIARGTIYAEDPLLETSPFRTDLNAYSLLDESSENVTAEIHPFLKSGESDTGSESHEPGVISHVESLRPGSGKTSRGTKQYGDAYHNSNNADIVEIEQENMMVTNVNDNEVVMSEISGFNESDRSNTNGSRKSNLEFVQDEDEQVEDDEDGDNESDANFLEEIANEEDEGFYDDDGDISDSVGLESGHNSLLLRELIQQSSNGGEESNILSVMQRLVGGFENSLLGSQISDFDALIENLENLDDSYLMLETVSEILERLLMMDGVTAERIVSSNKLASVLIGILKDPSLEDDLELHLITCRCLFNFIEVNTDFINDALNNGVVPVLASKLLDIVYIDLTEQCLQTLEIISQERESHNLIIACDGLRSCLQNLDFLTIHSQRKCLKIVANSCTDIKYSQFHLIESQFNDIYRVAINNSDVFVQELAWLAISRIVDCFGNRPEIIEKLFLKENIMRQILSIIQKTCNSDKPGSKYDNNSRICLLKSLVTIISGSVEISNLLFGLNIGEFFQVSLNNFRKLTEMSESLTSSISLNPEALISCPKDVLSLILEAIAYLLPITYPVHESPFLACEETKKRKDLNEARAQILSKGQNQNFLLFVAKVWPILVLAFQATMDFDLRKRGLICLTRVIFACKASDLDSVGNHSSLLSIFSSVLSGGLKALNGSEPCAWDSINGGPARSQALLIYGTCIIMRELLKKAGLKYSALLSKEGIFDDIIRIKETMSFSCDRIADENRTEEDMNILSEHWKYTRCFLSSEDREFLDGELADFSNLTKKPITKKLIHLLDDIESYHKNSTGKNDSLHLFKLNEISKLLDKALTKEGYTASDWRSVWIQFVTTLQEGDDKVTSYELFSLGIIKQLSKILTPNISIKRVPVLSFIETFCQHGDAFIYFTTLLHDSLSRSELFEVISSGKSAREGVSDITAQLTKQVKFNLTFGSELEKQVNLPKSVLMSVHSIATFESVDAYVKKTYLSDIHSAEKGFSFKKENAVFDDEFQKNGNLESKFSICGQNVSKLSTVFGAIYDLLKSGRSSNKIEAQNLWQKTYNVEYSIVPISNICVNIETQSSSEIMDSHSRYTLDLLKALHSLNSEAVNMGLGQIISSESFTNWKLTLKLNKQLDEPFIIASGCMPRWSFNVVKEYPFLFPIETRMHFMQSTSFGLSRLMHSLQVRASRVQNFVDDFSNSSYGQLGMPSRRKARISREKLLHSAIRVLLNYGTVPGFLEIEYYGEVGSGLGPTLEFYANVSHEFSKSNLRMWLHSENTEEYVITSNGLFPSAITKYLSASERKRLILLFHVLGIFVARSLIDSRILDFHFNTAFISLIQNPDAYKSVIADSDISLMLELLRQVDEKLAGSLIHLTKYFPFLNDEENNEKVQIDGMTVSDLCLTFVLPGNDSTPLVMNGSMIPVTSKNLVFYVKEVLLATLFHGINDQVLAFREGFSRVFPISSMACFSANELAQFFGNAEEDWSAETIQKAIKANHGYSQDCAAVGNLVAIMLNFSLEERRHFLQFLTGSCRLPIGGFQSIKPEFTVVEKHPEPGQSSDDYLPSVMTCANFLKLPNYSLRDIMRSRIFRAIQEGAGSFHLS